MAPKRSQQALGVVFLLRHAKARAAGPGMADRDRPLADAGWREARSIGAAMRERGYRPEVVVCSPARRTRETLEGLGAAIDGQQAVFREGLYSGTGSDYLAAIRGAGSAADVLVVGHNPTIESVCVSLAGTCEADAANQMAGGFPTGGLAVIRFPGPLAAAAPGDGHLEEFLTPASA